MIIKQIVQLIRKPHQIIIQSTQVICSHVITICLYFRFFFTYYYYSKIWTPPTIVQRPNCCFFIQKRRLKVQNSLKRDLEILLFPSQCCIWTPMASKYKLLLPWKPTTLPAVVVEVKNFPTSSPYGPYWPRLVWNVSDFMIVCFSSLVIDP